MVMHEVEIQDNARLDYKYAYACENIYLNHPNLMNILICLTDNCGGTYATETVRNPPQSQYLFRAVSFSDYGLIAGSAIANLRLNHKQAKGFVRHVVSYLLRMEAVKAVATGATGGHSSGTSTCTAGGHSPKTLATGEEV